MRNQATEIRDEFIFPNLSQGCRRMLFRLYSYWWSDEVNHYQTGDLAFSCCLDTTAGVLSLTSSCWLRGPSVFFVLVLLLRSRLLAGGRMFWPAFDHPERQCCTRTRRLMINGSRTRDADSNGLFTLLKVTFFCILSRSWMSYVKANERSFMLRTGNSWSFFNKGIR